MNEVGFSALPHGETKASMNAKYALGGTIKTPGWRPMEEKDVDEVYDLYNNWKSRYKLTQNMNKEELRHWIFGGSNQDGKVVHAFVVENELSNKVTDFISYYVLPFTVLQNPKHKEIGIAYLYYYASGVNEGNTSGSNEIQKRLKSLVYDAMVEAKRDNIDVFNALSSQDNNLFFDDLKFGAGDGYLNYYIFNYKAAHMDGGINEKHEFSGKTSDIGVVLL